MILQNIVVSNRCFDSWDPYDVIVSSIEFVDGLLRKNLLIEEIAKTPLINYFLGKYKMDWTSGGYSYFVYSSRMNALQIDLTIEGLKQIGAHENLILFKKSVGLVNKLDRVNLNRFLDGTYFDQDVILNYLNRNDRLIKQLQKTESLISLHSNWLRNSDELLVLECADMLAEERRIVEMIQNNGQ